MAKEEFSKVFWWSRSGKTFACDYTALFHQNIFTYVKLQIKFAKNLLGVNSKAANTAVLAELGMYPIGIQALKSSVELCCIF